MQGLSEFTLVMQTIARAVYDSVLQPGASTRQVTYQNTPLVGGGNVNVTWFVDKTGTPTPGPGASALPRKIRFDNVGNGADIKCAQHSTKSM